MKLIAGIFQNTAFASDIGEKNRCDFLQVQALKKHTELSKSLKSEGPSASR